MSMSMQTIRRCCFTGMASLVLAMPGHGQSAATRDSLGLTTLNQALRLYPGELSIDLTHGVFRRQAPLIKPAGGITDMMFTDTTRRDLRAHFVIAWDSGGIFNRSITSRSPLMEVEVIIQRETLERMQPYLQTFERVSDQLGPPDFCDRDTAVLAKDNGIAVSSVAVWRRGDVFVRMNHYFNYVPYSPPMARFASRFGVTYHANRITDPWTRYTLPTRRDMPCQISGAEFLEHEQPLDDASFQALREQLNRRVPRPPLP
jgi:hypothetical protein